MIYLDNAATTPLNEDVKNTYISLLDRYFYNSDSIYDKGLEVSNLLEQARSKIGYMLGCDPKEVIFTSCGSESNNMAIKGVAFNYRNRGKHIITTSIEHSSVLEACHQLEELGYNVTYLKVNKDGCIDIDELKEALTDDTILVSIMAINNEIGIINDIAKIGKIISKYPKIIFHVDMVQALGKEKINLENIDLASFSAHKINGLKGSGLLYKANNITLMPLISGGQQEFSLRAGTNNACTNIVLAKTLRLAYQDFDIKKEKVEYISSYLREKLSNIEGVVINSNKNYCISNIVNFSLVGYKPEVVLHYLEKKSIYISTRSACSSKQDDISNVFKQMHLSDEVAKSALRISISSNTSKEDIDTFIDAILLAKKELKKAG